MFMDEALKSSKNIEFIIPSLDASDSKAKYMAYFLYQVAATSL